MHGLSIAGNVCSVRRLVISVILSLLILMVAAPYYYHRELKKAPKWTLLKNWELQLPQHDLTLPYPEGATGRFVRFSVQSQRIGWNNYLAELLMNAHLAHDSGRGYVFPDFTWEVKHYPFPKALSRQWPPHTPLDALISGPVVGGSWDSNDNTPRSVSNHWFDTVCPPSEVRFINSTYIKTGRSGHEGNVMLREYATILRDAPERCIDIVQDLGDATPQLFDMWLWGGPRVLSLWEGFAKSPVSRLLDASSLVKSAVERNRFLFTPPGSRPSLKSGTSVYDRVLTMHLRRGDFVTACRRFAKYRSRFNGWNQLEIIPDRFSAPEDDAEKEEVYRRRCSPTSEEILENVKVVQAQYLESGADTALDMIYLMTNEKGEWLDQMIQALKSAGWNSVVKSQDLKLDTVEEQEVSMAIDMEIARMSAVFVGNGWSSFTSNIVHRRLVDGKPPISIRFH